MKKLVFEIKKIKKNNPSTVWSSRQDQMLLKYSKLFFDKKTGKYDWKNISSFIPNKNRLQCYRRYKAIDPIIKKGKWTQEEDHKLLSLVSNFGKCWSILAKLMKNRTSKQIRNRYNDHLNPKIKKIKFRKEEDYLIKKLYNIFSNKWSLYVKFLPYRSQKVIKRRYLKISKL